MAKQGFIMLHRSIQQHWIYDEKRKFSKYEAWLDMLMLANHSNNKFLLGNELIELEPGQFVTSIRKLGERWDWSNTKVTQFLDLLKSDEMIAYKKDTKKTVVTIEKYRFYQGKEEEEKTPKEHEKDTETTQKHTNNNVNKVKKEKKVKEIKKEYAERVAMTEEEYKKLVDQFGQVGATERIEKLSLYKGSTGKKYASDYLTILNWERKNNNQPRKGKASIGKNEDARKFAEENNIPF